MTMSLPSFKIKKISTKVALSFILIALLQGGLSILTLNVYTTRAMNASLDDQRQKTGRLIENFVTDAKREMVIKADLLAGQGKLSSLMDQGQIESLRYELTFYLAPLKLDAILVADPQGHKIVNVGNSAISDLLLKRNPVDLLDQGFTATATGGGTVNVNSEGNRIQLWSIREMTVNGKRRGILCVAVNLDRAFIDRIEKISDTSMLLALRKTLLVNGRVSDNVFIDYSRRVAADPDLGASGRIKSFVYKTTHVPDFPELELVYFIDTAPSTKLLSQYVASSLFILAATLAVAFVTSMSLYRYSFQKPFAAFQDAIRRIASGDLSFRFAEGTDTEFADLEREFEAMTANLRELERELQISSRMAAIGEMVAGVAHQIRNPLAIMKVSAEMLRDAYSGSSCSDPAEGEAPAPPAKARKPARPGTDEDGKLRLLVDMIVSEIDSLGAVVSRFLDFTKPLRVQPEEVALGDFLAKASALVPLSQFPGRSLSVEVSPGAETARFDRRLMEQAVCNLIENALAASEPGGVVRLSAERGDGPGIRIVVEDRGEGMGEEVRSQLFHPFFTTKSDGTGLGLSIVHRIVEEHGGSVEVRSEVGKGTSIAIVLPIERGEP